MSEATTGTTETTHTNAIQPQTRTIALLICASFAPESWNLPAETNGILCCAMLAVGMFLDAGETGEIQSFTAGKLSVTTRSGSGGRTARLKSCAESLLAPYSTGDFAFLGVRG